MADEISALAVNTIVGAETVGRLFYGAPVSDAAIRRSSNKAEQLLTMLEAQGSLIHAKLEAYYSEPGIAAEWLHFERALEFFVFMNDYAVHSSQAYFVRPVRQYVAELYPAASREIRWRYLVQGMTSDGFRDADHSLAQLLFNRATKITRDALR